MRAVLPVDALASNQAEVDLVDERGRLEGVPLSFSRHVSTSDPIQLVMDDRNEAVECRAIALSPCDEESGDVWRRW